MKVRDTSVLVYDLSGSYTHIAEALVGQVRQVYYFCPWDSGFPITRNVLPGVGLPGIIRIDDPFSTLEAFDWAVFTDVGAGGLQEDLRRLDIPVCGSGEGSILERDRWHLRTLAQAAGIQVAEAELVHGIDELREVLQEAGPCFVKMSYFRGEMETYKHRSWFQSEIWLNELTLRLGPAGKVIDFIVEEPIEGKPCVEVGFDTYYADGFPEKCLWGYEVKDAGFVGFTTPLPDPLLDLQKKTGSMLEGYDYKGPISAEFRVTPDGAFLIDITARFGSPPSEIQSKLTENFAEVLYGVATGERVGPIYSAPIAAQVVMKSEWAEEHALGLEIENMDRVALHGHCQIQKKDYVVSPANLQEFAGAVGWGETTEEAVKAATTAAEGVRGYQVSFNAGALEEAQEIVETGRELGITP